jgi:hypothetical protein
VDLSNNTASGGHAAGETISGFENLAGSRCSDVLSGGIGLDTFCVPGTGRQRPHHGLQRGSGHTADRGPRQHLGQYQRHELQSVRDDLCLVVEMSDEHGEFGTVILGDNFLGDISQVMGQIEIA